MNRHHKAGYQTIFTNDINNIEQQLQDYDPTLYIMHNPKDGSWLIMDGLLEIAIMKIPQIGLTDLDQRVYRRIREIHVTTGHSAQREIEAAEYKMQRDHERFVADLAEDFAKESHEAFVNAFDYGRESNVTKYVNGGV